MSNSDKVNNVISHKNIFSYFRAAYLFGSILSAEAAADIDIILVYDNYSDRIEKEKIKISKFIQKEISADIPVHFIVFNKQEIVETDFLNNFKPNIRII